MKVRAVKLCLLLGMTMMLLTGCLSKTVGELYAPPQLPADYLALQQKINEVMSGLGAEYAAPASGTNSQTIQLQDLDGDGQQESAIAFFRVANDEKPLKIYTFRLDEKTGRYETAWIIEGEGAAVYSVAYENLGGDEAREIVVSWQMSSKVHALSAYSMPLGEQPVELMRSGYTKAAVTDLDRDNEKEIIILQLDAAEENSRAEMYDYDNGLMVLRSAAPLSLRLTEIKSVKTGYLEDYAPALFVSSSAEPMESRVTDIITVQDNALTNITLDAATGMSSKTTRFYKDFVDVDGLDINSDTVFELPIPEAMPQVGEQAAQFLFRWQQYDQTGKGETVSITYHNYDDGWYLVLPEEWMGQITVARRDSSGASASTERAVTFYHWVDAQTPPEEFLTVYRLTGANRVYRANLEGRLRIIETKDVIYAAQFYDCDWDCGLDEDSLRARFYRIRQNWSNEG